jgi:hypothetical protein
MYVGFCILCLLIIVLLVYKKSYSTKSQFIEKPTRSDPQHDTGDSHIHNYITKLQNQQQMNLSSTAPLSSLY